MKVYAVSWMTPKHYGCEIVEAKTFHELEAAFWEKLGTPIECPIEIVNVALIAPNRPADSDGILNS